MPLSRLNAVDLDSLAPRASPADTTVPAFGGLRRRLGPLAFAALLVAWWLFSIGLRPLSLPDEGRYAGIARDMVVHGDWLVPRLDGLPFFHKPPLFYWLDALAMQLFGVGPATARAASVLGALLACAAVAAHARRVAGPVLACCALLALALQPLFFLAGQYANLDMLVAGCITATVLAWAHGLAPDDDRRQVAAPSSGDHIGGRPLEDANESARTEASPGLAAGFSPGAASDHRAAARRRLALRAGWVAAALGVLAKGLIGWLLPALVVLPWALLVLRLGPRRLLARWLDPLGVALTLAVALPWFVAMQRAYPGFLDYFVLEQHLRRFAGAHFNNPQPSWFYLPVLAAGLLPWTLALLPARGHRRAALAAPERRWLALWAWWALAVALFFSLPRSKLIGYVLPAVPPLALLCAWGLARIDPRGRKLVAASVVGALLCVGGVWGAREHDRKALRELPVAVERTLRAEPAWRDAQPVYVDAPRPEIALGAGLTRLPWIVGDWDDPAYAGHDDWRKELADAARFDPAAAAARLVRPADLARRLAGAERAWIVAREAWRPPVEAGGAFEVAAREKGVRLWRWRREAGGS
jgi:4-amino-4-deoxy-L-arabinose transferase-like glycosyltransferase